MNKFKRILVAYDGSEGAEAALEDLMNAGLPENTEALVLSVADVFLPPPGTEDPSIPDFLQVHVESGWSIAAQMLEDAKLMAERGARKLKAHFPGWAVQWEGIADSPAWGIVQTARARKPDLIVLGARGLSMLGRVTLGSISQVVLAEAPCSVRIVHRHPKETVSPVRIVAGIDGSSFSEAVLKEICSRHWRKGSAIHLVTALDARIKTALAGGESKIGKWFKREDKNGREWAARMLKHYSRDLKKHGLAVTQLVRDGDPKRVLLEEAEEWGADCIFIGVRGLSAVQKFFIGNVSSGIPARAHCTVEIVRAPFPAKILEAEPAHKAAKTAGYPESLDEEDYYD